MNEAKHCIAVWISEHFFLTLLGQWDRHLKTGGCIALPSMQDATWALDGSYLRIPEDVELDRVCYDWERGAFGIRLIHPSFPLVQPCERPPGAILRMVNIRGIPARQDSPDDPVLAEASR